MPAAHLLHLPATPYLNACGLYTHALCGYRHTCWYLCRSSLLSLLEEELHWQPTKRRTPLPPCPFPHHTAATHYRVWARCRSATACHATLPSGKEGTWEDRGICSPPVWFSSSGSTLVRWLLRTRATYLSLLCAAGPPTRRHRLFRYIPALQAWTQDGGFATLLHPTPFHSERYGATSHLSHSRLFDGYVPAVPDGQILLSMQAGTGRDNVAMRGNRTWFAPLLPPSPPSGSKHTAWTMRLSGDMVSEGRTSPFYLVSM